MGRSNINDMSLHSHISFVLVGKIQASPSQCCSSGSNWTGRRTTGSSGSCADEGLLFYWLEWVCFMIFNAAIFMFPFLVCVCTYLIMFFCSETITTEQIPGNLEEMVSEKRRELIEAVSEVDDKLAEAFLSDEPISPIELEVLDSIYVHMISTV